MGMLCSIFAMELCVRIEPNSPTRRQLHQLVAGHPRTAGFNAKWHLYRSASEILQAQLHLAERGCWDFFDDDERARRDFDMWTKGMTTREGARSSASGHGDPYRGQPRYMTFTMAFLMVQGSPSSNAMAHLCEVPEPALWRRDVFARLLHGMGTISFASVVGDVVYLIPGDEAWGLTLDDLAHPKFNYLRALT